LSYLLSLFIAKLVRPDNTTNNCLHIFKYKSVKLPILPNIWRGRLGCPFPKICS
jgi:hypothetical protein